VKEHPGQDLREHILAEVIRINSEHGTLRPRTLHEDNRYFEPDGGV